ncbi:solute carrier family 2, facilitated glucose transporter member 8-like isoform X1 [Ostrinia furnacalis]|uniref:solute carrier family 2, facilitated glucose transporter member 8-like isoform X1 n=2 Tax=Ostrinia furnacalis TaxID=93504 RepID=UPI00103FAD04|nr:solute carrier family 2, facilitated glucose transporter member 8-like isoform X1 [Ostrinia furnacalis]
MPLDLIKENGDDAEKMKLYSEDYSYKDTSKPNKLAALKLLCKSPSSRRAFIVVFISFSMEILMGAAPVAVYAKQVFIEADPTRGDMWSVLFAVMSLLGTMLSGVVSDRAGRRPLLIIASLVVSICLLALGVLLQTKVAPAWVGVLVLMTFCFCFMAGPGTIPYVLMSEIFCPEVQTLASMLIIEWVWLLAFFTLAVFHWLNRLIGIHATFYIFTFNSLFNVAFSYYMIPETKGLSNKEIQIALLKGRSK